MLRDSLFPYDTPFKKSCLFLSGGGAGSATTATATEGTVSAFGATFGVVAAFSVGVGVIRLAITTEATTTASTASTAFAGATATATTTSTASAAAFTTFFASRAALEVLFLFGLALSVGDNVLSEEEVLAHEGDTGVVEEPVVVAPSELLLDEAARLELAHELHGVVAGHFDALATEGGTPDTEAVLVAADDTFGEKEAVEVVTVLLGDDGSRHFFC